MRLTLIIITLLFAIQQKTHAQQSATIPPDSDRWEIFGENAEVMDFEGKHSLFARGGGAILRDANFLNGTIEFDIYVPEQRGFPGVFFRMEDDANYEEFYIRPHQSGNPDAAQYTPVYNGLSGWQLYFGPGFSGQMVYPFDTWMPVKIDVKGDEADIFVNNLSEPLIHVNDLKRKHVTGGLGLRGTGPGVYFANFRYTTKEPAQLIGSAEKEVLADAQTITRWSVSSPISEAKLASAFKLDKKTTNTLKWGNFKTEPSGLMNLASTTPRTDSLNTVFASVILTSEQAQTRKLSIAFSDRVRVYLNGKILYSARDEFRSRDYRYLGSIGYFDDVYLPLKEGRNELMIAVSENFGGWGLKAKLDAKDGLTWAVR